MSAPRLTANRLRMMNGQLAPTLRAFRAAHGLSQQALANHAGCSIGAIHGMEHGAVPQRATARKVVAVLRSFGMPESSAPPAREPSADYEIVVATVADRLFALESQVVGLTRRVDDLVAQLGGI